MTKFLRVAAVIAPLLAVAPIVLDLDGGWVALHLLGGAAALALLIYFGARLPRPWRWWTLAAVAVSIAVISIVTGGGTLGGGVQLAVLVFLGAVYVAVIFGHDQHRAPAMRNNASDEQRR